MVTGFVLVSVEPGKEMEAYRAFKMARGVKRVTPLLGDIDFILEVDAASPNEIAGIVIRHIRTIPGVASTKTLVEDEFLKQFEDLAEDNMW